MNLRKPQMKRHSIFNKYGVCVGGVASLAVILRWLPGSEKCSFPLSTFLCKGLVIGMHSGRESNHRESAAQE